MTATTSSWDNSQGVRFPKNVMKELHLSVGDKVKVLVENQKIVLEPMDKLREKYDIKDLLKQLPSDYTIYEEFDDKMGREEW